MSQDSNIQLFARASEVKSYFESTDMELAINKAAEDNDLKRLEYLVAQGEAEIARQDNFGGSNLLEWGDEF